ncbi:MAG TPA: CDF family Co(II)/Ni(II) efflux transporter DmeF [Caulobacteraceae bacterium]
MTTEPAQPTAMDAFTRDRVYLGADHARNEARTRIAAVVSTFSLFAQIGGGLIFNSMALTAGGLHMAAHVAALVTASAAYALARRYAADGRFSFGTGKLIYLAGFANAVALAVTALLIGIEFVERLIHPVHVEYEAAGWVAGASLLVNIVCALLLKPADHSHAHDHDGDLNIGAVYVHLWADVLMSLLALGGLYAGQALGWTWADPVAGFLGAVLVARFAWGLLRRSGLVLLDVNPSAELTAEVRERLSRAGERILDLHLWRLGPGHHALIAVIAADDPQDPLAYRQRLAGLPGLSHITVEVRPSGAPSRR